MEFFIIIVIVLAAYGLYRLNKLGKFDSKPVPVTAPATLAARITGVVNPPEQAERIADRDRNRAEGNADGGGLDGGIYMQGAFDNETEANGVVVKSNIIIHGTSGFTCVGIILTNGSDCTLWMKQDGIHDVGTLVLSVNAGRVTGKMHHGGGKGWIDGDVVGEWVAK